MRPLQEKPYQCQKGGADTDYRLIAGILGRLISFASLTLLIPLAYALYDGSTAYDGSKFIGAAWTASGLPAFATTLAVSLALGIVLIATGAYRRGVLPIGEGSMLLALFFSYMTVFGMLPYYSSGRFDLLDAFLESVSGFTTTGMTILPGDVPPAFVLWRSLTQWLGGLFILVAFFTVLFPLGGAFGLVLPEGSRAPVSRRLSSISRLALRVALTYLMVTAVLMAVFRLAGADFFDAVNLAFAVISSGGTHNTLEPGLMNDGIMSAALMVGMLFSSGNFLLYHEALRRRNPINLFRYAEHRIFLITILTAGLLMGVSLWAHGVYGFLHSLHRGLFEAVSFATTTGISTAEYLPWPPFARLCMLLLAFTGGCIGSASGGLKVARMVIMLKSLWGEIKKILHPQAFIPVYLGRRPVDSVIVNRVMGFFFLYISVLFSGVFLISLVSDLSLMESLMLGVSCLSSIASAAKLAGASAVFSGYPPLLKLVCALLMLIGRLEVFAFFLLFGAVKHSGDREKGRGSSRGGEGKTRTRGPWEIRDASAFSDSQSGSFLGRLLGGGRK